MSDENDSERCARCGSVGVDRRTLHMACFYAMAELGIPFEESALFVAEPDSVTETKEKVPYTSRTHHADGAITTDSGEYERSRFDANGQVHQRHLYTLRVCKRCRGEWMAAIKAWFKSEPQGRDHDADDYDRRSGCGSGIFVRENGAIREITRAEWDRLHPDCEPVVFRGDA